MRKRVSGRRPQPLSLALLLSILVISVPAGAAPAPAGDPVEGLWLGTAGAARGPRGSPVGYRRLSHPRRRPGRRLDDSRRIDGFSGGALNRAPAGAGSIGLW